MKKEDYMKIDLTISGQNVVHLLKSVSIYSWIVNSGRDEEDEDKSVDGFEQMILGLLYNGGMKDIIEFDEEESLYYLSADYEEGILEMMDDYEDESFWMNLASRLAQRDYEESGDNSDPESAGNKVLALEEKYGQEFEKTGIAKLKLV
jgi:hypothetical protein